MVTISVAIMVAPTPERRAMARELRPRLHGAQSVQVVEAFELDGRPWPTAKRAWMVGLRSGATHHLVLQEDITVCREFMAGLRQMVGLLPDQVLTPYHANRSIIDRAPGAWVRYGDGSSGQAILMPVDLVREFLLWEQANVLPAFKHDDGRVAMWLQATQRVSWAPIPSLVQHRAPSGSTLGQNDHRRVARRYIGDLTSALAIDWTRGLDQAPLYPGTNCLREYRQFLIQD